MNWFKERYEACMTILGILTVMGMCMGWMNSQFNNMNDKFDNRFNHLENRLGVIEKDLAIIKTVLVMKGIMPNELAHNDHDKQ